MSLAGGVRHRPEALTSSSTPDGLLEGNQANNGSTANGRIPALQAAALTRPGPHKIAQGGVVYQLQPCACRVGCPAPGLAPAGGHNGIASAMVRTKAAVVVNSASAGGGWQCISVMVGKRGRMHLAPQLNEGAGAAAAPGWRAAGQQRARGHTA
jgi:hypothetical protein